MTMVAMPRSSPIPMNIKSSDRPIITSGITIGP